MKKISKNIALSLILTIGFANCGQVASNNYKAKKSGVLCLCKNKTCKKVTTAVVTTGLLLSNEVDLTAGQTLNITDCAPVCSDNGYIPLSFVEQAFANNITYKLDNGRVKCCIKENSTHTATCGGRASKKEMNKIVKQYTQQGGSKNWNPFEENSRGSGQDNYKTWSVLGSVMAVWGGLTGIGGYFLGKHWGSNEVNEEEVIELLETSDIQGKLTSNE